MSAANSDDYFSCDNTSCDNPSFENASCDNPSFENASFENASTCEYDEAWVDKLLNNGQTNEPTKKALNNQPCKTQQILDEMIQLEKELSQYTDDYVNRKKTRRSVTVLKKKSPITAIEKQQLAWSVRQRKQQNSSANTSQKTRWYKALFKRRHRD